MSGEGREWMQRSAARRSQSVSAVRTLFIGLGCRLSSDSSCGFGASAHSGRRKVRDCLGSDSSAEAAAAAASPPAADSVAAAAPDCAANRGALPAANERACTAAGSSIICWTACDRWTIAAAGRMRRLATATRVRLREHCMAAVRRGERGVAGRQAAVGSSTSSPVESNEHASGAVAGCCLSVCLSVCFLKAERGAVSDAGTMDDNRG